MIIYCKGSLAITYSGTMGSLIEALDVAVIELKKSSADAVPDAVRAIPPPQAQSVTEWLPPKVRKKKVRY